MEVICHFSISFRRATQIKLTDLMLFSLTRMQQENRLFFVLGYCFIPFNHFFFFFAVSLIPALVKSIYTNTHYAHTYWDA